ARAADQQQLDRRGLCFRDDKGYGSWVGALESRSPLRAVLYDQVHRFGDGLVDMSLDHRRAWGTIVGHPKPAAGGPLHLRFAGWYGRRSVTACLAPANAQDRPSHGKTVEGAPLPDIASSGTGSSCPPRAAD